VLPSGFHNLKHIGEMPIAEIADDYYLLSMGWVDTTTAKESKSTTTTTTTTTTITITTT